MVIQSPRWRLRRFLTPPSTTCGPRRNHCSGSNPNVLMSCARQCTYSAPPDDWELGLAALQQEAHVKRVATTAYPPRDLRAHLNHVRLLMPQHFLDCVGDQHARVNRRYAVRHRVSHRRSYLSEIELV